MSVYTAHTDRELSYLLMEGDEGAFNEIYRRYWKSLFTSAYNRLKNTDGAREIVQHVFYTLWKHRTQLHILHLPGYLSAMTRHAVYRHLATEGKQAGLPPEHKLPALTATDPDHRHLIHLLEKFADSLPAPQRTVFIECKLRDQPVRNVSIALGISQRTAEGHIARAMKLLRKKLQHYSLLPLFWLFSALPGGAAMC